MLAIVVNFEIQPGKDAEAIAALEANAAGSRKEPGCLKWEWSRHVEEPSKFAIYELYHDRDAIAAHRASDHFQAWSASLDSFLKIKVSGVYDVAGIDSRPVGSQR